METLTNITFQGYLTDTVRLRDFGRELDPQRSPGYACTCTPSGGTTPIHTPKPTHICKPPGGDETKPNHNAQAMAAAAGMTIDGCTLHKLLLEISKLMSAALGEEVDASARSPDWEPGGKRHVPFARASDTTRDSRWARWVPGWRRCRIAVGDADASAMTGTVVANTLAPKGHGADPMRRLPDANAMLASILNDSKAVAKLKAAIAAHERSSTHVQDCVMRKRGANASYATIDAYRDLFLVKHPSRRAMIAATKKLIEYLSVNVMAAGEEWLEDESEVEGVRLRTAHEAQPPATRKDEAYRAYSSTHVSAAVQEAKSRGLSGSLWMKVVKEWWAGAPENPSNSAAERDVREDAMETEPTPETIPTPEDASPAAPANPDENAPMDDATQAEPTRDEAMQDAEEEPRAPKQGPMPLECCHVGGLLFAEAKTWGEGRGAPLVRPRTPSRWPSSWRL